MVRGYWCDVKIVNGIIQGQAKMNYRPPANPIPVVNPILIILLRDTECFSIYVCESRGSSRNEANDCRQTLVTRFGDGKDIVGLQVFYTDGTSLFEKYMACTEGYICDSLCIDKFKEYAVNKKPSITFADLDLSHLDMYVNVFIDSDFISRIFYSCSECYSLSERRFSRTSGFRARPGDDLKISSPEKLCGDLCHNNRKIEISSTKENIMGDSSYYSFYSIVTSKDSQVQIVWRKPNMRLPVSYTKDRIDEYQNYKAKGNSTRHMFLLLFSHTNALNGDLSVSTSGLVNIPEVFKLRAISWLLFEHQYFTPHGERLWSQSEKPALDLTFQLL
ncbi:uncharacterized protein LOC131958213 [Physella acuta]|uniref:uncharacterized protein LOC131958213 n=1 Tax=Physella acuta TaxID=109671 RepID=UPI0027DABE76|nr:uncharacterized protein LOC131958213 [Physella acuta]